MPPNYLIVASKQDLAGINITTQLSQFGQFNFYLIDEDILHTENLNLEKIHLYDFIIFASRHASEKKEKTISIHAPGNWKDAKYGGEAGKICQTSALFQKFLFEKLIKDAQTYELKDYKITLECTHHGPLINRPCIFLEIGSTEYEWKDRRAGFIVARALSEVLKEFKESRYREIAFGIGGPHYCPAFNKIQYGSNVAISHVIPQYALPVTEEMIQEAIHKTIEPIDFAVLDWNGIGNAEERERIVKILDKNYIRWKKTNEIK